MAETIKIPICYKGIRGIKFSSADSQNSGIDVDEENKIVKIRITQDPLPATDQIRISISSGNHNYCEDQDWLWWEREVDHVDKEKQPDGTVADVPVLERLPTISCQNPEVCYWLEAQIKLYGPPRCGKPHDVSHGTPYEKYDAGYAGKGDFGTLYKQQVPQNNIVPGMNIKLWHKFSDGLMYQAGSTWWCTCCFTGGIVKQVNGEYGSPEITYLVEIEGKNIVCYPTDFVKWAVGDWVFVAVTGGECENIGRDEACKGGCLEEEIPTETKNYRILPMRVGQDGA